MNQVESTLGEKEGAIQCTSPQKGKLISNLFVVSKEDGDHRPVINLKSLNNFPSYQDRRPKRSKVLIATERLHVQNRLEGRLFLYSTSHGKGDGKANRCHSCT